MWTVVVLDDVGAFEVRAVAITLLPTVL